MVDKSTMRTYKISLIEILDKFDIPKSDKEKVRVDFEESTIFSHPETSIEESKLVLKLI